MTAPGPAGAECGHMDDAATDSGRVLLPPAPDGIELRHLRAFVAVAEELNFGRAASLYLSQPALSRQIRSLERHVGCDLLRRSTHGVELTVAGGALLDRARPVARGGRRRVGGAAVGGEIAGRLARIWEPVSELAAADTDLQELRNATETLHAQSAPPPETTVQPVNTVACRPCWRRRARRDLPPCCSCTVAATSLARRSGTGTWPARWPWPPTAGWWSRVPARRAPVPGGRRRRAPYVWMLDSGIRHDDVTLAGDSSGGGLALSPLIRLTQEGLPLPGGAVLLSPAVDLTFEQLEDLTGDPARTPVPRPDAQLRGVVPRRPSGRRPLVNPLHADLTGFPPLLVQGGTGDLVVVDATGCGARREYGVDVRLELYPADTHDFQVFWSFLPEAADALSRPAASPARRRPPRRTGRRRSRRVVRRRGRARSCQPPASSWSRRAGSGDRRR